MAKALQSIIGKDGRQRLLLQSDRLLSCSVKEEKCVTVDNLNITEHDNHNEQLSRLIKNRTNSGKKLTGICNKWVANRNQCCSKHAQKKSTNKQAGINTEEQTVKHGTGRQSVGDKSC